MAPIATTKKRTQFEHFIDIHQSAFGSEKLLKTAETVFKMGIYFFQKTHGTGAELPIGLQQLASKLSDARYLLRYHAGGSGILAEVENIKNKTCLGGYEHPMIKKLFYYKSYSLIYYYFCENLAYAGSVAPDLIGKRLSFLGGANELGRRSVYGWVAFLLMDLYCCKLKMKELSKLAAKVKATRNTAKAKDKALKLIKKRKRTLELGYYQEIFFLIPATQYMLTPDSMFMIVPKWLMLFSDLMENATGYYTLWHGMSSSLPDVQAILDEDLAETKSD